METSDDVKSIKLHNYRKIDKINPEEEDTLKDVCLYLLNDSRFVDIIYLDKAGYRENRLYYLISVFSSKM